MKELESVTIYNRHDIGRAAGALQNLIKERLGDWRIAPCANLSKIRPMLDDDGQLLVTSVFGWHKNDKNKWWLKPRLAVESPLAEACRYEGDPFWCNALGFRTLWPNPLLDRIQLSEFERRSMTHAAMVVPVHMPFGSIGVASIIPDDPRHLDLSDDFAAHHQWLGVVVRGFLTSYAKTVRDVAPCGERAALSLREVECLRWAAVGKTNAEIGIIMSRSLATVRFHLHNASAKLNAVSRSQAVFKATQLGYIGLSNR